MTTTMELKRYANKFLMDNYGMTLNIPVDINGRLKRTMGYFKYSMAGGKRTPIKISIAKSLVEHNEFEAVLDTLYHECVHYALFTKGQPYNDGDAHFEGELRRLKVSATQTSTMKQKHYCFECEKCGRNIVKISRNFNTKYSCGKCLGRFIFKGSKIC